MKITSRLALQLVLIYALIQLLIGCATMTPLTKAALDGDIVAIRSLLRKGNSVNEASKGKYYAQPLHWAARQGHVESAKELLEAGADINGRDYCDQTPLIYAIVGGTEGGTEVAKMLIAKGADTGAFDCFGWRAINYAKRGQNAVLVSVITARSAGKIYTDIDDPDFKPNDIWVISYKQAILQVNYKGVRK
jgi:ankyrin repeat protein